MSTIPYVYLESNTNCILIALLGQDRVATLAAGILSDEDVKQQYKSGYDGFKPYIVNPEDTKTQTDRYLRGR